MIPIPSSIIRVNFSHGMIGAYGGCRLSASRYAAWESRLESAVAQPDQIIISGTTYQLVKDQIEARAFGAVNLRGRSGPVDIYEV